MFKDCAALLALGLAWTTFQGPAFQDPSADAIALVGRCSFERGGFEEVLADVWSEAGQERAGKLLLRHAAGHGWPGQIDDPDLIAHERAAFCPDYALDQAAAIRELPRGGWQWEFLYEDFAFTLARNGRTDQALELLEAAGEEATREQEDWSRKFAISFLAECAARTAASAAQWERALEYSRSWRPTSTCGNGAAGEASSIACFRARCASALGRCEDVRALALDSLQAFGVGYTDVLVETWIECLISHGLAPGANSARIAILAEVPVDAEERCRAGFRRWELAHMSLTEQIEQLPELARTHREIALPPLLSLGPRGILDRLDACDVVDGGLRQPDLAWLLACTGHPEVGKALERAKSVVDERTGRRLEMVLQGWPYLLERWNTLTSPMR